MRKATDQRDAQIISCCERAFCRSMVVMFCALKWSVLMSWCLLRDQVMWWSRHLMRCDGLCCVMSRNAMRCHGDELYYSSTTLHYKVLLQYYSVLQSTTPVLPCSTKYYSSTTLYYKVLLQYYSVQQSTTLYYSSTTLYYKVLLQYYPVLQSTSWLIRITYETSFTMRGATKGSFQLQQILCLPRKMNLMIDRIAHETSLTMRRATGITLQLHQILRFPRKMNLMIDPHHIWNVIYNARSNSQHPPTSPKYCACHAKWISWVIHITY